MDTDRNLLFGIISMQAGLINAREFVETCTVWAAQKECPLSDLLVERGLINETDKAHVEYLLSRRVEKNGGDVQASMASVPAAIHCSLSKIEDPDIRQSLAACVDLAETKVYTASSVMLDSNDRYELTELHAAGGIGQVWRAWDKMLKRSVALKELKPAIADDAALRTRFRREATITGQLEHPGIVPVYDFLSAPDSDRSFYTMRLVHGRTLADAAREFHASRMGGDVSSAAFIPLLNAFVTVCNTVAYAHSKGIIHRDLKGENVVLGDYGETVVLDWGFAKQATDQDFDEENLTPKKLTDSDDSELTMHGQSLGTPAFMAPEQAAGQLDSIDHRTDVYGLGSILFQVLTGQPPFTGSSVGEVLRKVQTEAPKPPRQFWPEVPPTLESACLRALAKAPEERFESAVELGREVEQWQEVQRKKAEEALRESEALYRSLVDMLPLVLTRKDLNSRFTFANSRACESFGKPLEEILGKTDFDFHPESLAAGSQASDRQVFETGRTIEYPPFWYPDRGKDRYFQSIKTPVRDARGEITGVQIVIWDVTERIELEEALRESEALYRSLVAVLPLILVRKDLKSRLTFVNKRFCDAIGKPLEEIIGKTDFDFFPEDMAEEYLRNDRRVFETQKALETEETFLEKGELRDIRVIKTPTYDARGELNGLQVIVWDISEGKRLEQALRESEAFYQTLVENLPQGIVRKDLEGRFTYLNHGSCELLGLSREEMLGKTDFDLFPPALAWKYRHDDQAVIKSGRRLEAVEWNEPIGKPAHFMQTVKAPVYDLSGNPIGSYAIFWDVTESKRMEEMVQNLQKENDRLRKGSARS